MKQGKFVQNEVAQNIVKEYNKFMRETREKIDETKRATMLSLKQLLKLADGDVIEIHEDDTLSVIPMKEAKNAG